MKIAIVGYGRMGHEIASVAKARGIGFVTIDPEEGDFKEITAGALEGVDVAVDFTHPDTAIPNLQKYAELKTNAVMGTTGWYGKMDDAKKLVADSGIGFIWSGNFSIGVNMFFRMVESASKVVNNVLDYDVFLHELHHNRKADSPSGTAEMIGQILLKNIDRKDKLVYDKLSRKIEPGEIHVSSTRAGNIPGTHVVGFDSGADSIELKHTARNRSGFALGAVLAAEFVSGKNGFYTIDDLMNSLLGE
ncbi:4-hydroxy-tetrahydrodipicolinate reductase [archaeon]